MSCITLLFVSCLVVRKISREIKSMKEHQPEWKYVVVLKEKDKSNPKVKCCVGDKEFFATWPR